MQIYSVFPNATKEPDEEYFEIQNTGCDPVDLNGYRIEDKSKKTFSLPSGVHLAHGEILRWYHKDSLLELNNTNESLSIFDTTGDMVDTFSYAKSTKNVAIF